MQKRSRKAHATENGEQVKILLLTTLFQSVASFVSNKLDIYNEWAPDPDPLRSKNAHGCRVYNSYRYQFRGLGYGATFHAFSESRIATYTLYHLPHPECPSLGRNAT